MSVRDIIVAESGKLPYTQWVKGDYKKEIALIAKKVSKDFHVMRVQISNGDEYEATSYHVEQLDSNGNWSFVKGE
jgi:hypothetical protein